MLEIGQRIHLHDIDRSLGGAHHATAPFHGRVAFIYPDGVVNVAYIDHQGSYFTAVNVQFYDNIADRMEDGPKIFATPPMNMEEFEGEADATNETENAGVSIGETATTESAAD